MCESDTAQLTLTPNEKQSCDTSRCGGTKVFAGSEQSLASYTRRGSTTRACRDAPRDAPSSLPPPAPTSDSSSLFHPKTSSSRYMKSSSSIGAPALDPGDPALGPGAAPDAAPAGGRRGGTTTVRLCAWLWLEWGSSVFNKIGLVLGPVETLGGCWRAAGEPIPNVLKYFRRHCKGTTVHKPSDGGERRAWLASCGHMMLSHSPRLRG